MKLILLLLMVRHGMVYRVGPSGKPVAISAVHEESKNGDLR